MYMQVVKLENNHTLSGQDTHQISLGQTSGYCTDGHSLWGHSVDRMPRKATRPSNKTLFHATY